MTDSSRPVVLKFGGTSVADATAVRRLTSIVRHEAQPSVVVVSALAGVTDALLALADLAAAGARSEVDHAIGLLQERHLELANSVADRARRALVAEAVNRMFDELRADVAMIEASRGASPGMLDRLAASGELLSSRIVASALAGAGLPAAWVDARRVIVTDDVHTRAVPQMEATCQSVGRELAPYLGRGYLPVVGGFVGATPDGRTTTLGRGGSDYSAAIIGACLGAREIQIWTDVDGMLTADPRLVEGPRVLSHLSFAQAYEMAYYGAKVLHPGTIEPAVAHDIPVRVLNSRRPDAIGTKITATAPVVHRPLTALAGKRQVTVLEIESKSWLGSSHQLVRRVLEALEREQATPMLMTVAEQRLTVALDDPRDVEAIVREVAQVASVTCHSGLGIVCAVGGLERVDAGLVAEILGTLDGVGLRMVSQPSSGRTVVFLLDQRELQTAMTRLHDHFFGEPATAAPVGYGPQI